MKGKLGLAGAVVIAILLFGSILFIGTSPSTSAIPLRHIKSVQSTNNITTMTFEITNHTANPYIFSPFEVQVRNGGDWSKFQSFDSGGPTPTLDPQGVASYTINVTNLPAKSVVQFSVRPQKILLGFEGFVRRAELMLRTHGGSRGGGISLNPYDRNSKVFAMPSEVASEEFVEPEPK